MAEPSLEESLKRLSDIVRLLEQNDTPLEESLKMFEEGVALARKGHERLNDVERRIEILTKVSSDSVETKPYESR